MVIRFRAGPSEATLAARLPALLEALEAGRRALAASGSAYLLLGVQLETGRFELAVQEERGPAYARRFADEGLVKFMRLVPGTFSTGLEAACETALRRLRWVIEEEARLPTPDGGPLVVSDEIVAAVSGARVA